MSFTSGGMGRRGRCTTKRAYPSHEEAARGKRWMIQHLGSYGPMLKIVECHHCGKYHVAHKLPKDQKGRRWE